jgi:hypothetical protein
MDGDVKTAQSVPDHQLITDHALLLSARKIKSSDQTCYAHSANGAQLDHFQMLPELPVSSNQDQPSMLVEFQAAANIKSSTLIELSVSHAQIIH